MTVFLMTIRESLPPTEKTPLISEATKPERLRHFGTYILFFSTGLYYGVSICLVSFASAMAVVTLNIHHRGVRGNEVPEVVKQFVLGFLSRFVFLHFDASNNGGGAGGAGGVRRINPFTHNAREENSKDPSGIYVSLLSPFCLMPATPYLCNFPSTPFFPRIFVGKGSLRKRP